MVAAPAASDFLAAVSEFMSFGFPSRARGCRAPAVCVALLLLAAGWYRLMHVALRPTALWTGAALLALVLLLTLFNARKKLPFLPLLNASSWTTFHVYAGWFAVGLFLLHVQFRLPRGRLETVLALLFAAVVVSGILGLLFSRNLPARLTRHGEEVIFERVPALRRQLQESVEKLALDSVAETGSSTLADFYTARLKGYFDRPHDFWFHLFGSNRRLHARLTRLAELDRYLSEKERAVAAVLTESIRAKDNLDFHRAGQGLLKGWLFVHIPLTYSLIALAIVHGVLAWAFTHGGG